MSIYVFLFLFFVLVVFVSFLAGHFVGYMTALERAEEDKKVKRGF